MNEFSRKNLPAASYKDFNLNLIDAELLYGLKEVIVYYISCCLN